MYLKETQMWPHESLADASFYKKGFFQSFLDNTWHISIYFDALIYRKIRHNSIWKICFSLFPYQPVGSPFREKPDFVKYPYFGGIERQGIKDLRERPYTADDPYPGEVVNVNAYFDFERYMALENDYDKSKALTDFFESELLQTFEVYGISGAAAAKDAFDEIREHEYIFRGALWRTPNKNCVYSPNRTCKVFFYFVWKLNCIEIWINAKKSRARRELCDCCLGEYRSDYATTNYCKSSLEWVSETSFVVNWPDLVSQKKIVDLEHGSVQTYEP